MNENAAFGAVLNRMCFACVSALLVLSILGITASSAVAGTAEEISVLPTVDTLKRTESPLSSGGKWAPLSWSYGSNPGRATTTGWGPSTLYETGTNGAYWTQRTFSDDSGNAAAITMQTSPGGESRWVSLWLNMPSPSTAKSGYELRWTVEPVASNSGYSVKLVKWVSGVETVLASSKAVTIAAGTTMAITDTGGTVTAWKGTGTLTSLVSASDATYSMGYAGMEGRGNASRSSDFKAGRLVGGAILRAKVLDDFGRYEVPLANGKWTKNQWAATIGGSWTNSTWHGYGSSGGLAGAYWNGTTFNDSKDAVLVGATVGTGSVNSGQYGGLWLDAPSPGSAESGYEARFTGTGSATAYKVELSKWVSGTRTVLATKEGVALPVGTTIAFSEQAGSLVVWTGTTTFTPIISSSDTTYGSGYVGIDVNGGQGTYYNFRGGSALPPPPDTTISEGAAMGVTAPTFGFAFTGSQGTTGFECSLDGAVFAACASPKSYAGISEGSHTYRVRALGAGGPDESPASRTVEVISADTAVNRVPLRDRFERSEVPLATSQWTKLQWAASIGGVWWGSYRGYGSSGGDAGAYLTSGLYSGAEGTVTTSAIVGNESRGAGEFQSLWLNSTNPATAKQGYEARYEGVSGSGYTVTLNKWVSGSRQILASAANVPLPVGTTLGLTKSGTALTLWSGKAGSYFQVLTANDLGSMSGYPGIEVNGGAGTLNNFRAGPVDITPPDTLITEGPSGEVSSPDEIFKFSSPDSTASFECSIDGAAYVACSSPREYQGLSQGSHEFSVRARDLAGNVDPTPATQSFQIGKAPDTTIVEGAYSTTAHTATAFLLESSEFNTTFECRLDSGSWQSCSAHPGYSNLAAGSHHFEARTVNEEGTVDPTPALRDWVVDPSGPLAKPRVSGSPRIGQVLSVSHGVWGGSEPTSYSYQWYRCQSSDPAKFGSCQAISGATGANYRLSQADQGKHLVAQVTATRGGSSGAQSLTAQTSETQTTTLSRFSLPALLEIIRSLTSERLVFYGCKGENLAEGAPPSPDEVCGLWMTNAAATEPVLVTGLERIYEEEPEDPNDVGWWEARPLNPTLSKDGSLIAFVNEITNCLEVVPAQANGTPRKVDCKAYHIPKEINEFWEPTFTPDGKIVYVDEEGGRLWEINVDGSGKKALFSWPNARFAGPSVSPDGTQLVFASTRGPNGEAKEGEWVAGMDGSNPRFIQSQVSRTDWSPDGSRLALFSGHEAGQWGSYASVYDLATNARGTFGPHVRNEDISWSADGALIGVTREVASGDHQLALINPATGTEQVVLAEFLTNQEVLQLSFRLGADPQASSPEDLLERYKPVVYYHPEENYRADSANEAIEWHENRVYEAVPSLVAADHEGSGEALLSPEWFRSRVYSEGDVLDERGDNQEAADWGHIQPGFANHVYGNEITSADGQVEWLQYWFFYYYNDSINAAGSSYGTHEGDWEFVQYAYDPQTEQITEAAYNQHAGAETCPSSALHYVMTADGRVAPAVFAAKGSHASYFHPGDYNLERGPLNFGNDLASDEAGPTELTMTKLNEEPWFTWEGHWGGTFPSGFGPISVGETSPTGPAWGANEEEMVDPDRVAEEGEGDCSPE